MPRRLEVSRLEHVALHSCSLRRRRQPWGVTQRLAVRQSPLSRRRTCQGLNPKQKFPSINKTVERPPIAGADWLLNHLWKAQRLKLPTIFWWITSLVALKTQIWQCLELKWIYSATRAAQWNTWRIVACAEVLFANYVSQSTRLQFLLLSKLAETPY